jgi:uncharacterized membrane protein
MPSKVQKTEKSLVVKTTIDQVSSLLEDLAQTPKWNPLLREIHLGEKAGKGLASTVEWKANVAGLNITGSSVATTWKPGKEYAWKNTEKSTGLSLEGRFILTPANKGTTLKAVVSYSLPDKVAGLFQAPAINLLISAAVSQALGNINRLVSSRK